MPSYEDVTQRAGSLRAMTGLTEQEFTALLPPFEHALVAYCGTAPLMGNPARAAVTVRMTIVPYPPWRTNCSSS